MFIAKIYTSKGKTTQNGGEKDMKRRFLALSLAAAIAAGTLAGCGSGNKQSASGDDDTLVVWTLAADLEDFAKHYEEETGTKVDVTVIAPADYPTKINTTLGSRNKDVDIIVGEPQMLMDFYDAGFFADLSEFDDKASEKLVDYVYEAGKDEDGVLRALSYQVTPGSVIYRRDLAKEVFGTDDPAVIGEKFSSYDSIVETAKQLDAAGYSIFGDTGAMRWFANADEAWVKDGKLQMTDSRLEYMDAAVELYQNKYVAFATEWSAAWYASMAGELPKNNASGEATNETTQVFSYVMPSWGALVIRDNAKDNKGNFGVAKGICSFFGGGTFIGVNEFSDNQEKAKKFVEFCTLNEDVAQWWLEESDGDNVAIKSVLEANKDYENPSFGNQKTYAFFAEEASAVDYSLITRYDTAIGDAFGQAIESIQKGEKDKKTALKDFYLEVQSVYPEIEVPTV